MTLTNTNGDTAPPCRDTLEVMAQAGAEETPVFHTVIGSLKWTAAHTNALRNRPDETWCGVFCMAFDIFKAQHVNYEQLLNEFSLLGDASRIDFFKRFNTWSCWEWKPSEMADPQTGCSLVQQDMKDRYPFFFNHPMNTRHLQTLKQEYDLVIYDTDDGGSFWTFKKLDDGPSQKKTAEKPSQG